MLTWCEHVDYISSVISKCVGVIRRVKFYLPCTTLNMLANALVFPYSEIVVQSGQIVILNFLTYFRFCKINLHVFFFLLILGLQLIICCAILTGSNWTKDGKSNFFRLYLSVSKVMLPRIFCLNLFLLLQFIPKIHAVKLQIRLLCVL